MNKIKIFFRVFKIYRYNPILIIRFIFLNFFNESIKNKGGFLIPYPGTFLKIAKSAKIELYGNLEIGILTEKCRNVRSSLIMKEQGRLCVNKKCEMMEGCDIQIYKGGYLCVDNFHSNIDLEVSCGSVIRLLGDVTAGRHVRFKDFNGHYVSYDKYPKSKPIIIEAHTWICTGAAVNPGVKVGRGSVVSDNSNVVNDIPACSFVQGNPASVICSNIEFEI